MAEAHVAVRTSASNPTRKCNPPKGNTSAAGADSGPAQSGDDEMNMLTSIKAASSMATIAAVDAPPASLRRRSRRDMVGPDLRYAPPIADVVKGMQYARNGFYLAFSRACTESGIGLTVNYMAEGDERLYFGCPCDGQEALRNERLDALMAVLDRSPKRRQAIVDLCNMLGRFCDNRPYPSVAAGAEQFLQAGGRIMLSPDGGCEWTLPLTKDTLGEEGWNGYPLRRLHHRFEATLRQRGAKAELSNLVRERGRLHKGSGWLVWEGGTQ